MKQIEDALGELEELAGRFGRMNGLGATTGSVRMLVLLKIVRERLKNIKLADAPANVATT